MILFRNHRLRLIFSILFVYFCIVNPLYGQKKDLSGVNVMKGESSFRQDTAVELRKRNAVLAEPDTNFTWEKYASFLGKISDTSRYIVLPLNEFRNTFNTNKIVIGLRHDLDNDLNTGYAFSEIEWKLGFRSSYFILHTAPYYLANPNNMAVHSESIIPILKTMQNDRHFEIGWHNDLVTLQLIYNINPVTFLKNELNWLRSNGIKIIGTAAHGSAYCKVYHYMNFYFFEECTYPVVPFRENNITVPIGSKNVDIMKAKLSDFNLEYEAYFLNNNKAFSDATITNGIRWNIAMLNLDQFQKGDRVILLLHPIHWHKASVYANIDAFRIIGQKSSSVDASESEVTVEMPYGTSINSLQAVFSLSPGAYAKVFGKLQASGSTRNNFINPLTYTVYAENREIHKDWKVKVFIAKNSVADFNSFVIPGVTKSVLINISKKTILVEVKEGTDIKHLHVQFELSAGARAWVNNVEQFSNDGTINFSNNVQYKVLAEDGIFSSTWTVTVRIAQKNTNFISFSVPGLIGQAKIDTLNNTIDAEMNAGTPLNALRPSFILSSDAHAWIGKQEQISDVSIHNFSIPVLYDVFSKDNLKKKGWKVTIFESVLSVEDAESMQGGLTIYPNPSDGIIHLQFNDVKISPVKIEIFNTLGEKVYTEMFSKTGSFTIDADLTKFPSRVYFVRYSKSVKPVIIVMK